MKEETITIELDTNSYHGSIDAKELFDSSNQEWLNSVQSKAKTESPSNKHGVFQNALPSVSGIAIEIGIILTHEVSTGILAAYITKKLSEKDINKITINGDEIRVSKENIKIKLRELESIPFSEKEDNDDTPPETTETINGQTNIGDFINKE